MQVDFWLLNGDVARSLRRCLTAFFWRRFSHLIGRSLGEDDVSGLFVVEDDQFGLFLGHCNDFQSAWLAIRSFAVTSHVDVSRSHDIELTDKLNFREPV